MRVLYVDIDSLRPDHLGCYGYPRETSPTIDRLAREGVRFERCFVSDSPCLPSRTALVTGRHGLKSNVVTHYGSGQPYREPGDGHSQDPDRPLTLLGLSSAGVRTATVTSFDKRHLAYQFTSAFREAVQPTASTGGESHADVTGEALSWLDRHAADDDWLLHVNYWDVHHPYEGIGGDVERVRESGPVPESAGPDRGTIDDQQAMTGTRCASLWPNPSGYRSDRFRTGAYADWPMPERFETREDVERLIDGYDGAIRQVDAAVERLLEKLEAEGVREETAVVVTADHGDALGEHGIYAEHAMAHPPCQRVPMIVSWPGVTDGNAGASVDGQVYQFDLVATLCDLAGLDVPDGWDAEPFTPALRGGSFEGRETLVCGHGIYTFSRAVYRDGYAYVRLLHPGVFSLPGLYNDPDLPGGGLELLHDLEADPMMTENLLHEEPERAAAMRAELDGFVADGVTSEDAAGSDPLARMTVESGPFLYVDREALGDLYREQGRDERSLAAVERAARFPDPGWE